METRRPRGAESRGRSTDSNSRDQPLRGTEATLARIKHEKVHGECGGGRMRTQRAPKKLGKWQQKTMEAKNDRRAV